MSARRSVQRVSSGRAWSPWPTVPGCPPSRRSPVRVQRACPPSRFRRPGSGGPARPVSGPSGVRPPGSSSGVRRSGRPVSIRLVSIRLVSAPSVRTCPSRSRQAVAVGPGRSGRGTLHQGNGSRSVGCRTVERLGRRPGPGHWRRCRARASVGGVGGGPGSGWVRAAAAALTRCASRQARPACAAPVAGGSGEGAGTGGGARLPHLRRGWRAGRGGRPRWVVVAAAAAGVDGPARARRRAGRGWACGPSAAQAGRGRSRRAADSAVTCGDGWWACQDLNLGPHPYQGCALTA